MADFRDQLIAASLKQSLFYQVHENVVQFPRSIDRGLIEADLGESPL